MQALPEGDQEKFPPFFVKYVENVVTNFYEHKDFMIAVIFGILYRIP